MASWPRWRTAALVALALSLGALVHARAQTAPGAAAGAPADALAQAEIAPVFQQLAALRGMAAPGPPPPAVVRSRAETRRYVEGELARRYSPARIEAERKSMVAWGLIPADYDLRQLFVDLLEEQVSAYYDPVARTMVLGDWLAPAERQVALLHELVHALQDRDVALDAFLAPLPGQGDRVLARQALVEGEAVAVMFDVLMRRMGVDLASLPDVGAIRSQIAASSLGPVIQRAPRFLRDLLLFPYAEGLTFVHQWRRRSQWSAIGALYRDPPRSSAQILHPDKFLGTRQDPLVVALPDLAPHTAGLSLVIEDEMGEFGLGGVLGVHLGEAAGRRTALGWRGDRFRVWEEAPGRFAIAAVIAMDTEASAAALAQALPGIVERRHPTATRRPGAGPAVAWRDGNRVLAVERRGPVVLLLEQVPEASADAMREAIWRARPASP